MTDQQIKNKIQSLQGQYASCTRSCPLRIKVKLVSEIRALGEKLK